MAVHGNLEQIVTPDLSHLAVANRDHAVELV
jgi:hypothetical protein